jgi:ribosomal protein S18 acetylase RimI-like enzyme
MGLLQNVGIAAASSEDLDEVSRLFTEYAAALGFDLGFQDFEHELVSLPGLYAEPDGCILIARIDTRTIGCVALKRLGAGICEMKRLYVRPEFRGSGAGRLLATAVIAHARQAGYERMRLDTIDSMREAIALYESLGFLRAAAYYNNPIPGATFFELVLNNQRA